MLEPHPDVETPESSTSIWRYMAIDKFLQLLACSSLWFSRCDYFEDGWEGRYSDATYDTFLKTFKGPEENIRKLWAWHQDRNNEIRRCLYVNCWHLNEEESAALWQIYSNFGKCVAVRSTIHKLRDAVAEMDVPIHAGRVKYCDYASEAMPMHNLFTPFLRKRRSFAFENELRLLHWNSDLMSLDKDSPQTDFPAGASAPVNLQVLIESVYLSPNAAAYLHNAITVLLGKFELNHVKIVQSNLFAAPS